nr:uncharacterized protein LOC109166477 [Ipomoea batatas]
MGLPLGVGCNMKDVFAYIETKLKHRLCGWNKKIVSRAGNEVFLKSVGLGFSESLERMLNKFWWDSSSGQGGCIHWMSWGCVPKGSGGMGFKSLNKFNVALLAKQGWRLLTQPTSLVAQILKARYYPKGDFLDANIGHNPSYSWRSILDGEKAATGKQGDEEQLLGDDLEGEEGDEEQFLGDDLEGEEAENRDEDDDLMDVECHTASSSDDENREARRVEVEAENVGGNVNEEVDRLLKADLGITNTYPWTIISDQQKAFDFNDWLMSVIGGEIAWPKICCIAGVLIYGKGEI